MTATSTKKPPTSKVEKIRKASQDRFAEAEQLLAHLAANDERPTPEDALLFASLGWDAREIRRQIARVKDIQRLKKQSGTAAQREAARKKLEQAQRQMHEEGGQLNHQLAQVKREVDKKLAGLRANLDAASAVCREYDQAKDQLRHRIPKHIKDQAEHGIQSVKADYNAKINERRAKIEAVERMQGLDIGGMAGIADAVLMARQLCPEAVIKGRTEPKIENTPGYVHPDTLDEFKWRKFVGQQAGFLVPQWQTEIDDLREQREEAVAEAEKALDFYLPE